MREDCFFYTVAITIPQQQVKSTCKLGTAMHQLVLQHPQVCGRTDPSYLLQVVFTCMYLSKDLMHMSETNYYLSTPDDLLISKCAHPNTNPPHPQPRTHTAPNVN